MNPQKWSPKDQELHPGCNLCNSSLVEVHFASFPSIFFSSAACWGSSYFSSPFAAPPSPCDGWTPWKRFGQRCFEGNMTHLDKIGLYCVNILQYFNMKLQLNTPWFPDISLSAVVWLEITIPVGVWKNVQVTSCRTTTQLSIIFALDWSI